MLALQGGGRGADASIVRRQDCEPERAPVECTDCIPQESASCATVAHALSTTTRTRLPQALQRVRRRARPDISGGAMHRLCRWLQRALSKSPKAATSARGEQRSAQGYTREIDDSVGKHRSNDVKAIANRGYTSTTWRGKSRIARGRSRIPCTGSIARVPSGSDRWTRVDARVRSRETRSSNLSTERLTPRDRNTVPRMSARSARRLN